MFDFIPGDLLRTRIRRGDTLAMLWKGKIADIDGTTLSIQGMLSPRDVSLCLYIDDEFQALVLLNGIMGWIDIKMFERVE